MDFDVDAHLGAVTRSVSEIEYAGKPARVVRLTRTFDTSVEDVWDAISNPERLPRWFLPITGELQVGGHYQLQGNAGGTITRCEPPHALSLTWEFGGAVSWVEVRLEDAGHASTRLTLSHIVPADDHWDSYGPGATGVGWELGLLGLALHTASGTDHGETETGTREFDEQAFFASEQGKAFMTGSSRSWGQASIAAGTDAATAGAREQRTTAFYTGAGET